MEKYIPHREVIFWTDFTFPTSTSWQNIKMYWKVVIGNWELPNSTGEIELVNVWFLI